MPAYNCEEYIQRAIESIINQSYDNWELIITEDCSTDNNFALASKYENERIHVFKTEHNSGTVYTPRLIAFNHAKGMYVGKHFKLRWIQKLIKHRKPFELFNVLFT